MDISHFIYELIIRNECVILRGVGGFDTTYKHASFDAKKKQIIPPSKVISFKPDWINDNGVLENHIVESLNISTEKASELIDDFVIKLFDDLKDNGISKIEGVGVFKMSSDSILEFCEIEDENYLADSFGLESLPIDAETGEDIKIVSRIPLEYSSHGRKLTGWYVAIGVLLLFVSVTILILFSVEGGIPIFGDSKNKSKKSDEIIVFGKQDIEKDTLIQAIEKTLDSKTSTKNALAPDESKKDFSVISSNVYYLVAGSFKSLKNAQILKEQLLRKGFTPEIMLSGNNQYRVVIGSFRERKPAIAELQRIRVQLDQSVWLLESREQISN
ncbi:MAG: SPOR domain-containing protein [Bacteroidales bacterium]|nr:SPOR domain-containing protein [Bacteroidales bacterium]